MIQKLIINQEEQELLPDSNEIEQKKKSNFMPSDNDDKIISPSSSRKNSVEFKDYQQQSPQLSRLQLPKIQPKSSSNISIPISTNNRYFNNADDQISQKVKTISSDIPQQPNITPGYKKYQIDEQNAQFDYIRGMFSEEEIKEAFNVLDMNKDGGITSEDLSFFLDFIGEKPTAEEVEEMIRMCDLDGSGEVKYEEFRKMAGGWSLTPLGQAYAPTKELVEKRTILNQMMMEKEIQEVAQKGKITPQMVEEIKKTELLSPRFGQDESSKSMFQSINNIAAQSGSKKVQRQVMGQNMKVNRSEEGQITQQNKQKSQLSQKEIMNQRKLNAVRFVNEKKIDQSQLQEIFNKFNKLDIMEKCTYEDLIHLLDLQDNHQSKLLFNSMTESPIREEYVKNADDLISEQVINLKETLLTLLGVIQCRKHDKLEIAYLIQDSNTNGFILLDDLINLLVYLYCISDVAIIEQKILKMTAKKGLKNRKDIIKKELYISMINEYGQVFEPI